MHLAAAGAVSPPGPASLRLRGHGQAVLAVCPLSPARHAPYTPQDAIRPPDPFQAIQWHGRVRTSEAANTSVSGQPEDLRAIRTGCRARVERAGLQGRRCLPNGCLCLLASQSHVPPFTQVGSVMRTGRTQQDTRDLCQVLFCHPPSRAPRRVEPTLAGALPMLITRPWDRRGWPQVTAHAHDRTGPSSRRRARCPRAATAPRGCRPWTPRSRRCRSTTRRTPSRPSSASSTAIVWASSWTLCASIFPLAAHLPAGLRADHPESDDALLCTRIYLMSWERFGCTALRT